MSVLRLQRELEARRQIWKRAIIRLGEYKSIIFFIGRPKLISVFSHRKMLRLHTCQPHFQNISSFHLLSQASIVTVYCFNKKAALALFVLNDFDWAVTRRLHRWLRDIQSWFRFRLLDLITSLLHEKFGYTILVSFIWFSHSFLIGKAWAYNIGFVYWIQSLLCYKTKFGHADVLLLL